MLNILPFISEFMVSKPEYPADTQKKKIVSPIFSLKYLITLIRAFHGKWMNRFVDL